jgi:hypothetical protein
MKANGRKNNGCLSHHSTPVNPPSRDGNYVEYYVVSAVLK